MIFFWERDRPTSRSTQLLPVTLPNGRATGRHPLRIPQPRIISE